MSHDIRIFVHALLLLGKWHKQTFIDNNFPGKSPQEAVYAAGINCYTTLRNLFAEGGYDRFMMAMGDHEIGDNGKCRVCVHKYHTHNHDAKIPS